ncbi:MAG: AmmeMemoRadiSam system radical SAM enzyme [Desulfobulbus sp.]|jgi:pyruvate formate lyase activating enzyme|nr:AmmeMemoRadiSam system radical SAM enzyme [Desulfobulbus sp.]
MYEALFYQRMENEDVVCDLCSHHCRILEGRRGLCGVRENQGGRLVSLVYGLVVAHNVDPIEKKPLFHFLPSSLSYSIATMGCNFQCLYCQNYQISQCADLGEGPINGTPYSPEEVVADAERTGCRSISYTYVEPAVFYEFARDCGRLARERGLRNVFVSNGYMSAATTRDMGPWVDGINIDLKAYSDSFYRQVCKARLQPVLDSIRLCHELGIWVEVTTLLIPGLNDGDEELRDIARFLRDVSPAIPWHVTGFSPTYRMLDRPSTPAATLRRAREIGLEEGLLHIYQGNVSDAGAEDTRCPGCGGLLIARHGFYSRIEAMAAGRCTACGQAVAGVWV